VPQTSWVSTCMEVEPDLLEGLCVREESGNLLRMPKATR
jgi:hypothetical protein